MQLSKSQRDPIELESEGRKMFTSPIWMASFNRPVCEAFTTIAALFIRHLLFSIYIDMLL